MNEQMDQHDTSESLHCGGTCGEVETPEPSGRESARGEWIRLAAEVCESAAAGDLEARLLHIDDSDPELSRLLHGINNLLDLTDAFVREATATLAYAGKAKFFRGVLLTGMRGSFRRAAESINSATSQMAENAAALKKAQDRRLALADDCRDTRKTVEALADAAHEIGGLAEEIGEIAGRTNIVAMNASIEAARVGPAGMGFAVVANDVRQLAAQTGQTTVSIKERLTSIDRAARKTTSAIDHLWTAVQGS